MAVLSTPKKQHLPQQLFAHKQPLQPHNLQDVHFINIYEPLSKLHPHAHVKSNNKLL